MKSFLTAVVLVAASAHMTAAQSIEGTWTCVRNTSDNNAVSNVTFTGTGELDALVNLTFLGLDQTVEAQARYRSEFLFRDGMLSDTPVSARVNKLIVDGQDATRTEHAETLRQGLLENSEASAKVRFTSENDMIVGAEGGPINCVRM